MEHTSLTLEDDAKLIDTIMDDIDMRYIILFLYVIRNDLFKDLSDENLIESYNRILNLDEIYKNNVVISWDDDFTGIYIDLGLIKNIRSEREFDQKEDDFILRLGEETITIEQDTISVPDDTLFLIINKKFKFLTRRNFNLALTRLKGVRCERSSVIHSLIFEIGEHDYTLSDDMYYILDQFGNIYQAIKIEITIEGVYKRFGEIKEKINEFIKIFDSILNTKPVIKKINNALGEDKDVFKHLKEEDVDLSDKFKYDKIDNDNELLKQWKSSLLSLLKFRYSLKSMEHNLLEIKKYYSGKNKKFKYLEFIEKITYNEEDILDIIQNSLIEFRKDLMKINDELTQLTKKEIKLLNIDYERLIITESDE
ncbi:MAG: hypothetical protein ACW986_00570 [Promethearchaeota archaeon]|jgi:hypothetical protein